MTYYSAVGAAFFLVCGSVNAPAEAADVLQAGAAKVEVTPQGPVHLINVKEPIESTSVSQKLYARALAIGDGADAVVLISFDGIGVPGTLAQDVALRLKKARGIPRERIAICATHTHWAPHLTGLLGNIYGGPLPDEHQRRVDAYTALLADRLETVALKALDARGPSRASRATGRVTFAANRRLEPGGTLLRDETKRLMVTWNPLGPVDHSLPVMAVREAGSGKLRAIHFTYACHNVALTGTRISGFANSIHGDWAGLAQEELERRHPGCIAICTIGCGGDQRPDFCGGVDVAAAHAREIGDEIDRLLKQPDWHRIAGPIKARLDRRELPLGPIPSAEELQAFAEDKRLGPSIVARAFVARHRLIQLQQGGKAPSGVPLMTQSWRFHEGPTLVFLSGEVCIDYQLRIKRKYGDAVWPIAYANATPCYIVSRRMLENGGYEAGNSMFYYGWLRPLQPAAEEIVMQSVAAVMSTDRPPVEK